STRACARISRLRERSDTSARGKRPSGGTGRRSGLKIHRPQGHPGSIPGRATRKADSMINLLLSIAAGIAGFLLFFATGIAHAVGSIFPGVAAAIGAYIFLARRSGKLLEAVMAVAQKEMMARKPDRAVAALEEAFKLARWQFGVKSSLHANIGVLL